ncbi:MAG: outer membrane beta-barrel protein [bacterium]
MKKYTFIFLTCILFVFVETGYTQRILGALSAGINLTQVDGDEVYGYRKVGFNGGPSIIIPFGKKGKWSVTMEILFSQMGSYQKTPSGFVDTIPDTLSGAFYFGYKLSLNYVQIPLLVHFTDRKIIAAGVGFAYGQLVDVKEWENGIQQEKTNLQSPYAMGDLQVLADVRVRIWNRLWADVRYSYSLLPLRTREFTNIYGKETWTRKQYNNVITLRFTWIFNDPYIKERGKKIKN